MNIGKIGPSYVKTLKAQRLGWSTVLGELIDNSFDAGATRVDIKFDRKTLVVEDNGSGCVDIQRMLTLGAHFQSRTTKSGMYGVGLKESAGWLWGDTRIESKCKGRCVSAFVNWERLSRQETWDIADPVVEECDKAENGTKLRFANIIRDKPGKDAIVAELSYVFSPALAEGRQIEIRMSSGTASVLCAAWQMPKLLDEVDAEFEVEGKPVRLRAGIVPPSEPNPRHGFSFVYGHRIIFNSSMGSKGHSTSRICGIVTLDRCWTPGKNKTDLAENDASRRALEDAIYEHTKHLYEKAASQAVILQNAALQDRVTAALRSALAPPPTRKEKRGDGDLSGTVTAKGTGRRRLKAKKTQPGTSISEQCRAGELRMEFISRDDDQLGTVDMLGGVIYLNSSHSRVAWHREHENADALADSCCVLLAHEAIHSENQSRLKFAREYDGFVTMVSDLLKHQATGQPKLAEIA